MKTIVRTTDSKKAFARLAKISAGFAPDDFFYDEDALPF